MKVTLWVVPGVLEAAKEQISLRLRVLPSLQYDAAQGGLGWRRGLGSYSPHAHAEPQFPFFVK